MGKILLLLENGLLAQLYKTNLSVYLESQVDLCSSFSQFLGMNKLMNDYSLIVTHKNFDGINVVSEILNLQNEKRLLVPSIIVGESNNQNENVHFLPEYLNIQQLLGLSAKIMNITAQMMASLNVPDYYPIDIEFIYYLKKAPTSLYLYVEPDYVMFATKDSLVEEVAQELKEEGVEKFYIKANERLEIVGLITRSLMDELSKTTYLNPVFKTEIITNGFDHFMNNYVSKEASQSIVKLASDCSKMMNEVVNESPDLQSLFLMFKNNKDNFLYIHTMLSSYVASHILRNLPWGNESHVDKIIYVLFFHDIYLAPIYNKYPHLQNEELLKNSMELTRQEKHTLNNHARFAAELVAGLKKTPIGCDQLIRQHHGVNTGIGFAIELKEDLSPLAKVIIISENFVEYFLSKRGKNVNQPFDLAEAVQSLNEKFTTNSYRKIIEPLITLNI